jgi:hypothetical protein
MFTGESVGGDYSFMATRLGLPSDDRLWMKCLFGALRRLPSTSTQPSPVLVLDDFNNQREVKISTTIARALFQNVYQMQLIFTIIFITQSLKVAKMSGRSTALLYIVVSFCHLSSSMSYLYTL